MWSWRIGSILGIDLRVHFTFPLVLVWAALEFGRGRGLEYALFGAFLVLLLFGCVVLHELGHAVAALRYGIPVSDITLLPIGGLAKLRAMQDDPKQELVIAGAGPLVNVIIALVLLPFLALLTGLFEPGMFTIATRRAGGSELMGALFVLIRPIQSLSLAGTISYLFFANIMLAVFNLLPAFPMDGGRIFRALLALVLSYRQATIVAVRLGQLLALGFAFFGLRGNPGLLLVAAFVFISGGAELQRVALREVLARGLVGTYMMRGVQPLEPQWSLYAARVLAQQSGQRAFPVVEQGQLLGLLSVREMQEHAPGLTVGEAMVEEYPVLGPAGSLYDAQLLLQGMDRFAAAVMEGGVLLGLLSLEDIERGYQSLRRQRQVRMV
ncbi:MAG TPA: site-2 protease family protein [Ardenticatenaceae bacterium]|jgi:Zn-dependent protease